MFFFGKRKNKQEEEKKRAEFLLKKFANLPNDVGLQEKLKKIIFDRDAFKEFDDVIIEESGFNGGDVNCQPYQLFLKDLESDLPEDLEKTFWSLYFFIFCSNSYESDRIRKEHRISNIYQAVNLIFELDEIEPLLQHFNTDLESLIRNFTEFLKDSITDTPFLFEDVNEFIIVYDENSKEFDWEVYDYERFKKDNKSKVFDFYQFYLDLESAVTISDFWKIKEYRDFFGLYFKTFSQTKSLLDKSKRNDLITQFISSKQLSDLICNQIYKNFNN